jgi:large subunit ribosomal protein L21
MASGTIPPLMYAVIKVGGKQYRVEQGQKLLVDRQPHAAGDAFAPVVLMTGGDEVVTDRAKLEGSVSVSVVEHLRGEKIKVFTFKPKRGFKKTRGHRSELTRISVESIGGATKPKRSPARKAEPEAPVEAVVEKPAAKPKPKPAAKPTPKPATAVKPKTPAKPRAAAKPKPKADAEAPAPKPRRTRAKKEDTGDGA